MKEIFLIRQVFTNGYWDGQSFRGMIYCVKYDSYEDAKAVLAKEIVHNNKYVSVHKFFQIDKIFT